MTTPRTIALSLFALILSGFVLTACGGFGSFSFTEESQVIEVEGKNMFDAALGELFPATIPLTVDLEQRLEEQDASGARAVYLTELEFRMTDDSDEEDFGFLDAIEHIRVDADDQEEQLLAWKDDIPEEDSFFLDVDDDLDLKPYVESGMDLRTRVSGDQPNNDARFRVYATFRVQVL